MYNGKSRIQEMIAKKKLEIQSIKDDFDMFCI